MGSLIGLLFSAFFLTKVGVGIAHDHEDHNARARPTPPAVALMKADDHP